MSTPRMVRRVRSWLSAALAVALVTVGIQAAAMAPASAAVKGSSPAPVSNAFSMGGGAGGSVDPRTGAFEAQLPLVNVADPDGTGLSLAASYSQSLALQGAATANRFGLGAGWSIGLPWVQTAGGVRVYPASGGSYAWDTSTTTGLAQYPLQDLKFTKDPNPSLCNPESSAPAPAWTLTYLGGTTDQFDACGNLIEQTDRFGNSIGLTWSQSGQLWHLMSVTDSYGQVYKFDWSVSSQIKITSPPTAAKIAATVTLHVSNGLLDTVTDALGQQTSFRYVQAPGQSTTVRLLHTVVSPTGETTGITYRDVSYQQPNLDVIVVDDVTTTDASGHEVQAPVTFNINPTGNPGRHNYLGWPSHVKTGTDGLFASGDFGYQYVTSVSNGTSEMVSTYNSLHLLVTRQVRTGAEGTSLSLVQTQSYAYPKVTSVTDLPPNYGKPASVTTVYGDPHSGATRTVTTGSTYNNEGQQLTYTDAAGNTTTTTYDPKFGLPLTQTVTGHDGTASVTTNTLSTDGKSVDQTTTAVGTYKTVDDKAVVTASARTVVTYAYNPVGQVTGETEAWDPAAKPKGPSGGPDQIADTQTISVNKDAHTQTDVATTAAGTPQAASATTVTDLVTGQVLSNTNADGQVTSYTYDALGRQLTKTAPGGLLTKTDYTSPTVTTVTAPSGLITQTTTDVLGRTLTVTDNVSGQKLGSNPKARTVQTNQYSPDGSQLTTVTPDGTTATAFDALGRVVSIVHPGGITQTDKYNDVANTQTVSLLASGSTTAISTSTDGFNDLNQATSSSTSYPDGTDPTMASQHYDGIGRATDYSTDGLTATTSYAGAGGLQTGTTLTPTDPTDFPGSAVSDSTANTMTGALTTKSLTSQATNQDATAPATGTSYTYNAAGQIETATDPAGHVTSYTYTPAGQIATATQADKAVTTYTYDKTTGQLTSKDIKGADGTTEDTGYTYYPATGQVKSVYDPDHPDDAITYDYDADGHVVAQHYPDGQSTNATYTDAGRLATLTDTTGAVTTYHYNDDGNCGPAATDLCSAVQVRGQDTLASVSYLYDSLDRIKTVNRGNKVSTAVTYTDANQVATETTTGADGSTLQLDEYTYDAHGNVSTHTVTTALPAPASPSPAATGKARGKAAVTPTTTTTLYQYDAYNRLLSSAVYPGTATTGHPDTRTSYTVDTAGNVTGQQTTSGGKTVTTVDKIDNGQLTSRTVDGGTATAQAFDDDGNVTTDLAGNTYTYTLAGQIESVKTAAGITTMYLYWPDGTRRSATTTGGTAHAITYHYTTSGQIADETYTGAAAGASGPDTVTSSYLLAVHREARTLQAATGNGPATAQDTGPGTGYYLSDAHGSVEALVDGTGQVTASYAYSDYGQPTGASPTLLATPAATPEGNAEVNPFGYDGAYTNPSTGTQYLPARTYDPDQGRFLSLDSADQINRYQAFSTNPVNNTDPTGRWAFPQILTDAFAAALFIACGILSGGASVPILAAAIAGVEGAAEAVTAAVVFNAVSAVTNIGAAATSATLTAEDAAELAGTSFLSDTEKENLTTANTILGTIGTATGVGAGIADSLASGAEETKAAMLADPDDEVDTAYDAANQQQAADQALADPAESSGEEGDNGLSDSEGFGLDESEESSKGKSNEITGQRTQIPPDESSSEDLNTSITSPEDDSNPETGQVADLRQQVGQDANFNPAVDSSSEADSVPDSSSEEGPESVSEEPVPTSEESLNQEGNPLANGAITGTQNVMDGNSANANPAQPADPANSSFSEPVLEVTYDPSTGLSTLTWIYTSSGF